MGLSDRDYMRERPQFAPPQREPTSPIMIAVIFLLLLYALYKAFALWGPVSKPPGQINLPTVPSEQVVQPHTNPDAPSSKTDTPHPAFHEESLPMTVTKCVKNGKVTFTDGGCPQGATRSTVSADNPMVGTVAPPKQDWSVPRTPPPVKTYGGQPQVVVITQSNQPTHAYECKSLSQQIEQLDAIARQPLPGHAQDNIRAERTRLRTRQAHLGC